MNLVTDTNTPVKTDIAVGDVFYASWGYDETHINFYQVVRVTPAGAEIVPVVSEAVEQNGPGGDRVVPTSLVKDWDVLLRIERSDARKSKVVRRKAYSVGKSPVLTLRNGYTAYLHEAGRTYYQTDPRWGR
jgi:hypothetical protein